MFAQCLGQGIRRLIYTQMNILFVLGTFLTGPISKPIDPSWTSMATNPHSVLAMQTRRLSAPDIFEILKALGRRQ